TRDPAAGGALNQIVNGWRGLSMLNCSILGRPFAMTSNANVRTVCIRNNVFTKFTNNSSGTVDQTPSAYQNNHEIEAEAATTFLEGVNATNTASDYSATADVGADLFLDYRASVSPDTGASYSSQEGAGGGDYTPKVSGALAGRITSPALRFAPYDLNGARVSS